MKLDPTQRALLSQAARRYKPLGVSAHAWAKGKLLRDPLYSAILPLLPARGVIADLGCGEGYALALAYEKSPDIEVIGIDHDERRLRQARCVLQSANVTFRCEPIQKANLPSCQAVLLLDVLHYLPADDQDEVLKLASAAAAPGGIVLVRDVEPGRGLRSAMTRTAEQLARLCGRHRGQTLCYRPARQRERVIHACGLQTELISCAQGTPFANILIAARRPMNGPVASAASPCAVPRA